MVFLHVLELLVSVAWFFSLLSNFSWLTFLDILHMRTINGNFVIYLSSHKMGNLYLYSVGFYSFLVFFLSFYLNFSWLTFLNIPHMKTIHGNFVIYLSSHKMGDLYSYFHLKHYGMDEWEGPSGHIHVCWCICCRMSCHS